MEVEREGGIMFSGVNQPTRSMKLQHTTAIGRVFSAKDRKNRKPGKNTFWRIDHPHVDQRINVSCSSRNYEKIFH
jgi:chorismate-pyruvate lyase